MKLELYFAPGACSFVPHVGLEAIKAAAGQDFEPKMVKLHKGEQKSPEYLAINPNGQVPVLVDAGVGTASDASIAMELGCDGVLMNTAIAAAREPVRMAQAMKKAVEAGREAWLAGRMPKKLYSAAPSSPTEGKISPSQPKAA